MSAALARGASIRNEAILRRAIVEGARSVQNCADGSTDRWSLGHGMIDVQASHEWLLKHEALQTLQCRYVLQCDTRGSGNAAGVHGRGRGVYLREPQHTSGDVSSSVSVTPVYDSQLEWGGGGGSSDARAAENRKRVELDVQCLLRCSAPWVSCAACLPIYSGGKSFDVKIACDSLPAGGAYFAEVQGFDSKVRAPAVH